MLRFTIVICVWLQGDRGFLADGGYFRGSRIFGWTVIASLLCGENLPIAPDPGSPRQRSQFKLIIINGGQG